MLQPSLGPLRRDDTNGSVVGAEQNQTKLSRVLKAARDLATSAQHKGGYVSVIAKGMLLVAS